MPEPPESQDSYCHWSTEASTYLPSSEAHLPIDPELHDLWHWQKGAPWAGHDSLGTS